MSVLITGAGSGFGRGAAVELARRGHSVIATTVSEAEAVELAAAHPELITAKLDITDPDDRLQGGRWRVCVLVNKAWPPPAAQHPPSAPVASSRRTFDARHVAGGHPADARARSDGS
jgi:NAD(P)-dependent dehydrogenase (short-subunit alcohol dehydrogenase family)